MKVLFCHDGPMRKDAKGNYYGIAHNDNMFKRYYKIADELHVLTRQSFIDKNTSAYSKITLQPIKFIKVDNFFSKNGVKKLHIIKKKMRNAIREVDFVVIRVPSFIGFIAEGICRDLNKPYIIEVVGCAWDALINHGSMINKVLAPIAFLYQKRIIKRSEFTTYITKKFLQNRYPTLGNTQIIPNVLINPVENEVLKNRISKINSNKNKIKFGLIGSLDVDYKGHDTVLKALSLIKEEIPNFEIQFLGSGNSSRWTKLAYSLNLQNNVTFMGTLRGGQEVFNWIDNLDIAIQPSTAEAQGRSIIEEMSRGCPIIATSVGGIVELLSSENLIEANDHIDLSKKIKKLINSSEKQVEIAKENFKVAEEYYYTTIEERMNSFYQKFIHSNLNDVGK